MNYNDYWIYKENDRLAKLSEVRYNIDMYFGHLLCKPFYWLRKIFGYYKKYDR